MTGAPSISSRSASGACAGFSTSNCRADSSCAAAAFGREGERFGFASKPPLHGPRRLDRNTPTRSISPTTPVRVASDFSNRRLPPSAPSRRRSNELPQHVLSANGIRLPSYATGRRYTTCPQCSRERTTAAHRKAKALGATVDGDSVRWGCNHCGWTGPSKGNGSGETEPFMSYVYRDKDGAILFRKVRNTPGREPQFFLQKWNGLGWEKGTSGVDTSFLYRADELAKAIADGLEIIAVEGEKDADNLWRLGFAATCNAHGASAPGKAPKWKKKHSDQLTGGAIVVLNDHDAPGAAQAVCKLSVGVAKSVRRLNLADHWPDIPRGGDVSDWLDHGGGSQDKLATLTEERPPPSTNLPSAQRSSLRPARPNR